MLFITERETLRNFVLLLVIVILSPKIIKEVNGTLMERTYKCTEMDLEKCASTAESLIKDPGLIFPDKPSTLDRVCRTWEDLTICINNYTTKCYTRAEKYNFDKMFNESIESMTFVCKDFSYRADYLRYAPCVKRITTDGQYCGIPYQILIDQISNSQTSLRELCCKYSRLYSTRSKFKACILSQTEEKCDETKVGNLLGRQTPVGSLKPMNISTFAQQVVDKSLAFIAQQCSRAKYLDSQCINYNGVIVRPNSKGPLAENESIFNKGPPPGDSKFQIGTFNKATELQKNKGSGSSLNSVVEKNKQDGSSLNSGSGIKRDKVDKSNLNSKESIGETDKLTSNSNHVEYGNIPPAGSEHTNNRNNAISSHENFLQLFYKWAFIMAYTSLLL